jgi:hypothetical protein
MGKSRELIGHGKSQMELTLSVTLKLQSLISHRATLVSRVMHDGAMRKPTGLRSTITDVSV